MPRPLDLSDKAVELMAYLSLHRGPGGSNEQTARALWPTSLSAEPCSC
jgi:DNA-binding response OmpR family regulator